MPPLADQTLAKLDHVDIGILTVISAELDAALHAFQLTRTKDAKSGTIYWKGAVRSELKNTDYTVVLTCVGEPGNPAAAAAATELLLKYEPQVLLLMGIAAGMRGKTKIGDVVLSERVVAYEPAALTKSDDGVDRSEPRPDIDRTPHTMMQDVVNYRPDTARLDAIFKKMGGEFPCAALGREAEYAEHVAKAIGARQATIGSGEKLLRDPEKLRALRTLHGKLEVVEMEAAGLVNAARRLGVPWLVVRGISDFGDEFKDDFFHMFASKAAAAVLLDFVSQGLDLGSPPPSPLRDSVDQATREWLEETRDVIGSGVRVPRDKLKQQLVQSIENQPVTLVVGESGSGKSALVKAIHRDGALPELTWCIPAQEAASLIARRLDREITTWTTNGRAALVIDGLERITDSDEMRLVARLLRTLNLASENCPWRVLITCQTAAWDRARQELTGQSVPLQSLAPISVGLLDKTEVAHVAARVADIAPALARDDLRPVTGRPKVLDLLARAAQEVGLPDVTRWVGESSLIEWAWDGFLRGGPRGDAHVALLQDIAARQSDARLFAIPIAELTTPDRLLVDDLVRVGVLLKRHDTVRFAHDLYADYARQRYLLAIFHARRFSDLKQRLSNPLWHRGIRLLGLHLLEFRNRDEPPNIDGWRRLVGLFDERQGGELRSGGMADGGDQGPGAGVDLLLEAIAFSAQPGALLNAILDDLVKDRGALLKSFLFRFQHAAVVMVPIREFMKPSAESLTAEQRQLLDQIVPIPAYPMWSPLVAWIGAHRDQVVCYAPSQFLDAAEFWLTATHVFLGDELFGVPEAQTLAAAVVDLAEATAAADPREGCVSLGRDSQERLYRLMLLCGRGEPDRVRDLVLRLSGQVPAANEMPKPWTRQWTPPSDSHQVHKPTFWPFGPKKEPSHPFRRAALDSDGAEWLVRLDPEFASGVFLSLLIEVPDPNSDDRLCERCGYHFDTWRSVYPPFWDFAPAQALLSKNPSVGVDFIIKVADFGVDRWAERWPHVARAVDFDDRVDTEVPKLKLVIDGVERVYVGDARVLEWHRGGSQGPEVAAAVMMALEHWLYVEDDARRLDPTLLTKILRETRSVAVVGVLFDLALKSPAYLFGPLEPLAACPALYLWGRWRTIRVRPQSAMTSWGGKPRERFERAREWHGMEHRGRDFLLVVARLFAFRGLVWPVVDEARLEWRRIVDKTSSGDRRHEWIRDMLLPYFDKSNWQPASLPDGRVGWEYQHPTEIDDRQAATRRAIEAGAQSRHLPLRCRRILDGEETINEAGLIEIFDWAANPLELWSEEDRFFMGGAWTPRCAAAAVAILRFEDWLLENPTRRAQCEAWLRDACLSGPWSLMPDPSVGDAAWDSFCADVLPALWARRPADGDLRRCLAHLVAAPHQDARRRLFGALARRRAEYQDDFGRLLHLAAWAARLVEIEEDHLLASTKGESAAQRVFARLSTDFVDGRLAVLPEEWVQLAEARLSGSDGSLRGIRDGFSNPVLMMFFSWLAGETAGYAQADDRDFLLKVVKGVAEVVPRRLRLSDAARIEFAEESNGPANQPPLFRLEDDPPPNVVARPSSVKHAAGEILGGVRRLIGRLSGLIGGTKASHQSLPLLQQPLGTPYQSDYAIAEVVAAFLVREPRADHRRLLWEPWLGLEEPCHRWVELFLDRIYIAGADVPTGSEMRAVLEDIFAFAFGDDGWLDGESHRARGNSDVARAFIGFGDLVGGKFWIADQEHVAVALRHQWPRWADTALNGHGCAAAFARLLRTPAFRSIRPSCLPWLVRSEPTRWMSRDAAQIALAKLLELVWQERQDQGHDLAGDVRDVFEQLLGRLVALRVPEAIHLSGRVASEG